MSSVQDPFYVVKEEVQQSVNGISTLFDRWRDLLEHSNTAQNEEFKWTTDELKSGIKSVEYDLTDLEETISIVENNKGKFKVEPSEIEGRRQFVNDTKKKIQVIKDELLSLKTKSKMERDQREILMVQNKPRDKYAKLEQAIQEDNEEFIKGQGQRQEQIIREQDDHLDVLSGAVGTLKNYSNVINTSLNEQKQLIEEIDHKTDKADSGMKGVMRKVNNLIDATNDSTQVCIIIFLLLAFVGLVILVVYV